MAAEMIIHFKRSPFNENPYDGDDLGYRLRRNAVILGSTTVLIGGARFYTRGYIVRALGRDDVCLAIAVVSCEPVLWGIGERGEKEIRKNKEQRWSMCAD